MSTRSVAYRRDITELCHRHHEESLNSTMMIIDTIGPTGFLLKEENESKNFKVFLGDPHQCTCSTFKKDNKELCKHICWLLLKKFRLPQTNECNYQKFIK
jgi:E3 ubiquitin-protein ligase ZSWIM2